MSLTQPPFRADHVGSLLRPKELLRARDDHKHGGAGRDDQAIDEAVKKSAPLRHERDVVLKRGVEQKLWGHGENIASRLERREHHEGDWEQGPDEDQRHGSALSKADQNPINAHRTPSAVAEAIYNLRRERVRPQP